MTSKHGWIHVISLRPCSKQVHPWQVANCSFKICYNLTRHNSSSDLCTYVDLWQWAAGSSSYWTIKSIIYICTQSLKPQQQCKQEKKIHKMFRIRNEMFLFVFFLLDFNSVWLIKVK